jgi:hypothetical protein
MAVGMPFCLLLQQFGQHVHDAFGHTAYWVGSSMGNEKTAWRDVDVRLLIEDEEYERMGFGDPKAYPNNTHSNGRWVSTVLAWSCFGKHLTGLPIDFQIQPLTWANANENGPRGALFDLARACRDSELWDRAQEAKQ